MSGLKIEALLSGWGRTPQRLRWRRVSAPSYAAVLAVAMGLMAASSV